MGNHATEQTAAAEKTPSYREHKQQHGPYTVYSDGLLFCFLFLLLHKNKIYGEGLFL